MISQLSWDGTVNAGTILSAIGMLMGFVLTAMAFYNKVAVRMAISEHNSEVMRSDLAEIKHSLCEVNRVLSAIPTRLDDMERRIERLESHGRNNKP